MSKVLITKSKLDAIATAINTVNGTSLNYTLDEMATAVSRMFKSNNLRVAKSTSTLAVTTGSIGDDTGYFVTTSITLTKAITSDCISVTSATASFISAEITQADSDGYVWNIKAYGSQASTRLFLNVVYYTIEAL